ERDLIDYDFVREHSVGLDEVRAAVAEQSWERLETLAGVPEAEMRAFGQMIGEAKTAVLGWGMGITQHEVGEGGGRAVVNLGLTRGFVGRERCGVMPIRGHSGVQGGAEVGAYSTALPGGLPVTAENAARLSEQWGFEVPTTPGLTTPEMIDAAHR